MALAHFNGEPFQVPNRSMPIVFGDDLPDDSDVMTEDEWDDEQAIVRAIVNAEYDQRPPTERVDLDDLIDPDDLPFD